MLNAFLFCLILKAPDLLCFLLGLHNLDQNYVIYYYGYTIIIKKLLLLTKNIKIWNVAIQNLGFSNKFVISI